MMTPETLAADFHNWATQIGSSNVGQMGLAARAELEEAIAKRQDDIGDFSQFLRDQKLPLRRYWPNGVLARPDFEIAEIDLLEDSLEWRLFSAITCAAHEIDELRAELAFRRSQQ